MTYRFSPEPLVETSYFERPGALGSRAAGQTIVHAINERFDGIVRPGSLCFYSTRESGKTLVHLDVGVKPDCEVEWEGPVVEDCMRMTMPFRIPILANLLVLCFGHYIQTLADDLPPAAPKKDVAIQLETKTGKLDGTVDLPAGNGPFPVVILLPGSGPTDRDGNQPQLKNDCLKQLGEGLARRGIAVVRYDRRGVGKSAEAAPKEEDYRFDMLVADVLEWVRLLEKDVRFSRIGIVGHSEGALVGMLAAKRTPVAAYVSLAGAGRSLPDVLREQLGKNLPESQRAKWEPIVSELEAGRTVSDVPKELSALFRPSVQPYLISLFKIDPARELSEVKVPVLIVQGTTDVQVSTADSKRLSEAKKDAKLYVVENMNHVFKRATTPAEQRAAYFDPAVPVMPEMIDEVAAFLNTALAKPR